MSKADIEFVERMEKRWASISRRRIGDIDQSRLLELARKGAEAPEWQPIGTAPKDTTEVIVMIRPKLIRLGWYFAPSSTTFGWCDESARRIHPTYWTPMPTLPKEPLK